MNKKLPNTLLIGAQKAGTTSIYDWISQHEEVYAPPQVKDFHFFTNEEYYKKGIEYYSSFITNYQNEKIILAGGVNFIYHKKSAKRIYEFDPNIRLILILRNPIDRAYSAYNYFVKTGVEDLEFCEAISVEKERSEKNYYNDSNFSYIKHGFYSDQIEEYLKYFSKEQLFVGIFENIIKDKQKFIKDITEFLDINNFNPNFSDINKSGKSRVPVINKLMFKNSKFRSFVMNFFRKIIPVEVRTLLKNKIMEANTSNKKAEKLSPEFRTELSNLFKKDIIKLEKILKIDLTIWN